MKKVNPFKFTGPLDPEQDHLITINRMEELKDLVNGLSNQIYYALVAPRQTGKTTLLLQFVHEMKEDLPGFLGIYLTLEDLYQVERGEFYKSLVRKIITSLTTRYQIHPSSLKERYASIYNNLDLKDFLVELAGAKVYPLGAAKDFDFYPAEYQEPKFILLIDEIDAIPQEIMIEFVKTIRSIYIERLTVPGFKAYSMILCGSADLASLTFGKSSPFNISKVIYLRDFWLEEITDWFRQTFQHLHIRFDNSFIHQLFEQTRGHPYLTQLLCFQIVNALRKEGRDRVIPDDFKVIDQIISSGDINLLTTLEKIKNDELHQEMILKILKGEPIQYSRSHGIIRNLELAGAIRRKEGYCRIRNLICEKFLQQYFGQYHTQVEEVNHITLEESRLKVSL